MKIYVGNLAYGVTEGQLEKLFQDFGSVASVSVMKDKYSGESKGFGFVEFNQQAEAEEAIKALNGRTLDGRDLIVNIARPRNDRSRPSQGRR